MGYDRSYTREEIHQMLYLSERRLRPSSKPKNAQPGHAISQHTEQRSNPFDRRRLSQDTTFSTRKDLVLAVEEALQSNTGQQALASMNGPSGTKSCTIAYQLSARLGQIKADVVLNPMAQVDGKTLPAEGPAQYFQRVPVNAVLLVIDRCGAAESWAPLHVQTAYPQHVALP